MDLRNEFLAALKGGADHDALLDLVHRHQARGLGPQQAYQVLQDLWLEFGFDRAEEGSNRQENLEYVMEKIWYECPAPG
jgi:hypothetical protein